MPAVARQRKPVKESVKDGDGDGFRVGPDGKDDVPVSRAAAPVKTDGKASTKDVAAIESEIAELRARLKSGTLSAAEARSLRGKAAGLKAKANRAAKQTSADDQATGTVAPEAATPAPAVQPASVRKNPRAMTDAELDDAIEVHAKDGADALRAGDYAGHAAHVERIEAIDKERESRARANKPIGGLSDRDLADEVEATAERAAATFADPAANRAHSEKLDGLLSEQKRREDAKQPPAPPASAADKPSGEPTQELPVRPKSVPSLPPAESPPKGVKAYAGASDSAVAIHAKVLALADAEAARVNKAAAARLDLDRAGAELKATVARVDEISKGIISGKYGQKELSEYREIRLKLASLQERFAGRSEAAKVDREPLDRQAHSLILFPESEESGFSVVRLNRSAQPAPKGLSEGSSFFGRLVGKGSKLDGRKARVITRDGGRAFSAPLGIVGISESQSPSVVVHEFAHIAERTDKSILKSAIAFREKRRADAGQKYEKLNDIEKRKTGVAGTFGGDEEGFEDKFFDAYCGKRYRTQVVAGLPVYFPQTGTEIVSMGAQKMYEDPVGFAKSDPEYFQFTLTALQGNRRKA